MNYPKNTFSYDIQQAVGDDTIIACTWSPFDGAFYPDKKFRPADDLAGTLVFYEKTLEVMNYTYDSGFGSMDCHDLKMWSEEYVYYIHEYDGSTSIAKLLRNPPWESLPVY